MDEFSGLPPAEPTPAPIAGPMPDKRWSALRKVPRRALTISLATTALVVAGGAVLAGAVTAAPAGGNGTPTPAAPGQMAPNGKGVRMAGPMQAVHGEYVVPNGQGGYQTEEMQRGSVTAVNGNTFTVKSDDGYTHDWVTDSNTMQGMQRFRMMPKNDGTTKVPAPTDTATNGGVTTGQNVMVMGTKDGDTFHAVRVMPVRQFAGKANGQAAPEQGYQQDNPKTGQQQNGKVPFPGGRRFGHRGGGGGGMQGDMQSAPTPDQAPSAPESSPTPTQSS
ncbi:MAG TPA: hypothetical protein VE081_12130 [Sporichthyaceae bacterium]|nr:hypothetical protein [Sporichthyaceae bacterium]